MVTGVSSGVLMTVFFRHVLDRVAQHPWNRYAALLATGLYLLHTANAETINYITARSDSLSTLCVVAAFVIGVKARGAWRQLNVWSPRRPW